MKLKLLATTLVITFGVYSTVFSSTALADTSPPTDPQTPVATETVVARLSKSLIQDMSSIDLIKVQTAPEVSTASNLVAKLVPCLVNCSDYHWVVRTVRTSSASQEVNLTAYRYTIDLMLASLTQADIDPVIMKIRDFTCKIMLRPTPELAVLRHSDKTGETVLETVLTDQSCAYTQWLAPQSASGEEAAKILYRFMLDSVVLAKD